MAKQDILLDEDFDLKVKNGDFVIGASKAQQESLLLLSVENDWKNAPWVNTDVSSALEDDADPISLKHRIQSNFERDGLVIEEIKIEGEDLKIRSREED